MFHVQICCMLYDMFARGLPDYWSGPHSAAIGLWPAIGCMPGAQSMTLKHFAVEWCIVLWSIRSVASIHFSVSCLWSQFVRTMNIISLPGHVDPLCGWRWQMPWLSTRHRRRPRTWGVAASYGILAMEESCCGFIFRTVWVERCGLYFL